MKQRVFSLLMAVVFLFLAGCTEKPTTDAIEESGASFFFPSEEDEHEGTWLSWPHKYADKQTYYFGEDGMDGEVYVELLEPIWVEITKSLHTGETVHIIAYNEEEQARIGKLLEENDVDLEKVDFVIMENT